VNPEIHDEILARRPTTGHTTSLVNISITPSRTNIRRENAIIIEMVCRCKGHWHFATDGGALIGNAMTESVTTMREGANETTNNANKVTESAMQAKKCVTK
jgi:hypothetical protein